MGNWINKEWSQQVNQNSDDESNKENSSLNGKPIDEKSKARIVRKKVSGFLAINNFNSESYGEYSRVNTATPTSSDSTPVTNKVLMADFDPRSPSSDIVRTPIFVADSNENKKSIFKKTVLNNLKYSMIDPRSPSNDYNRTPIQVNKYGGVATCQDQNDDSINLNQPNLDENESESVSTGPDSPFDTNSKKNIQQVPESNWLKEIKNK